MFFAGKFTQKVDEKRRVSVPASFRAILGGQATFYAFPSLAHDCVVECRTSADMALLSERIDDLDPLSDEQSNLASAIFGDAHALTPDSNGRIVLPNDICAHIEVGDQCTFVGVGKFFNLHNPVRYAKHRERVRFRAADARKALRRLHEDAPRADGA